MKMTSPSSPPMHDDELEAYYGKKFESWRKLHARGQTTPNKTSKPTTPPLVGCLKKSKFVSPKTPPTPYRDPPKFRISKRSGGLGFSKNQAGAFEVGKIMAKDAKECWNEAKDK